MARFKLEDLPPSLKSAVLRRIKAEDDQRAANRVPVPASDVQPNPRHGASPSPPAEKGDERVVLRIHSIRHRLTDPDGACAKWLIDSLVHCGVLKDDSPRYVKEVRFTQEKSAGEEKTIVTIERGDGHHEATT